MNLFKQAWSHNLDEIHAWFHSPLNTWRAWFSWRVCLTVSLPAYLLAAGAAAAVGAPGWAKWGAYFCLYAAFLVWLKRRHAAQEAP